MLATNIFIVPILAIAVLPLPLHGDQILTEVNPVSWIDKSETVYNEFVTVNIEVDLYSPCSLQLSQFTENLSQFQWKMLCNMKYEAFMLPLTEICPVKQDKIFTEGINQKQQTINVNLGLLVGYWSVFGSTSVSNDDISDMKLNISNGTKINKDELLQSSEIRKALDLRLGKINLPFVSPITLVSSFHMGWDVLTALDSTFVFSRQEESWTNEKRIDTAFLKLLGIPDYKAAFGDVLLQSAKSFNCFINPEGTELKVSFSVLKATPNLKVFHAVPVVLIEANENYFCRLTYNGTRNIVWSTKENCVYDTDLLKPLTGSDTEPETPFFIESNGCLPQEKLSNGAYFTLSSCYNRTIYEAPFLIDGQLPFALVPSLPNLSKFLPETLNLIVNQMVNSAPLNKTEIVNQMANSAPLNKTEIVNQVVNLPPLNKTKTVNQMINLPPMNKTEIVNHVVNSVPLKKINAVKSSFSPIGHDKTPDFYILKALLLGCIILYFCLYLVEKCRPKFKNQKEIVVIV